MSSEYTIEGGRRGGGARKCALILAGAAGKGPFAAGALSIVAQHLNELDIVCVAGTSSGALNGAVFAAGLRVNQATRAAALLADLWKETATARNILTERCRRRIVSKAMQEFQRGPEQRPVSLRIAMTSLAGGTELVHHRRHYSTYEATATYRGADFETEQGIDRIAQHAVASGAIPFIFAPVRADGTAYVDGGVVDNAPIKWALEQDPEIEDLIVVTSDPRLFPPPRRVGRFPFSPLLDVIVRERLTRDLHEAYSFNKELRRLEALGVDMRRLRRELHWRPLKIIEIRPQATTPGHFVTGFFRRSERCRNWSDGREAAARELEQRPSFHAKAAAAPTVPIAAAPAVSVPKSQHLRKSCELVLVAPIKQGIVPVPGMTMTYPGRLEQLLSLLFSLRQAGVERYPTNNLVGPLETIASLHFVQWAILDQGRKLLLAVTFEGPWESYIHEIVDKGGPFLDAIFCHCEGYYECREKHSTADGYAAFASWVREHQVQTDFFYSAVPGMTARDAVWLGELEKLRATAGCPDLEKKATQLAVMPPDGRPSSVGATATIARQTVGAFFYLSALFPEPDRDFLARAAVRQLDLLWDPKMPLDGIVPAPSGAMKDALDWYKYVLPKFRPTTRGDVVAVVDAPETVQGNILKGYEGMTYGGIVLLRFTSPAAATFVGCFRPSTRQEGNQTTRNIALTFAGLRSLGLDPTILAEFPEEFREGMEHRAPMLGDVGVNHPYYWERLPAPAGSGAPSAELSTVDAVVIYQSKSPIDLDELFKTELGRDKGVQVLGVQKLQREGGAAKHGIVKEPFGFDDGISQPVPRDGTSDENKWDQVALGELLLGYPNEKGETPSYSNPAIFKNGSFLAMRKFQQNVEGLDTLLDAQLKGLERASLPSDRTPKDWLKGKIMGRYPDGTPLAADWKSGGDQNNFNYGLSAPSAASASASTPTSTPVDIGQGCPFAAHVRRANPRLKGTPRILRRGFGYRDATNDRGLVFMAYCASLGAQYEVVQKWVNGGNSNGTYGGQVDPMFAIKGVADDSYVFEGPGGGVVRLPTPAEPLARVKWGLYLFAPSTTGLTEIAALAKAAARTEGAPVRCPYSHGKPRPDVNEAVATGESLLHALKALDSQAALDRWHALLESDDPLPLAESRAVEAALRTRPGLQPTDYGVLASRKADCIAILENARDYSVCEYGRRMSDSFGLLYLGQDSDGGYEAAASAPNAFIAGIGRSEAYGLARTWGRGVAAGAMPMDDGRLLLDLQQWVDRVLCELVGVWFGFPEETVMRKGGAALASDLPCCPDDFRMISGYIFTPRPTEVLSDFAQRRGRLVKKAAADFTRARAQAAPTQSATLIDRLLRDGYMGGSEDAIARTWVGAVNGFTVPTGENFMVAVMEWLDTADFWRLQQEYYAAGDSADVASTDTPPGFLVTKLSQSMLGTPVPYLLHRRVKTPHDVTPGVRATPATPVALLLTSAGNETLDKGELDTDVIFGGAYKPNKGPGDALHACPGREMAMGVMMGLAAALFEQKNVRAEGTAAVSIDRPGS